MIFFRAAAIVLFFALTACASTTVNTRLALEPAKSTTLKFGDIDVTSSLSALPVDVADRLKTAVSARLAMLPQGATPAKVQLSINEYRAVSAGERFMVGVLAGANRMTVRVQITDDKGNPLGDFDVERSANSGAYGAFMDEKSSLIESAADGVAEALGAPKKK
jgi:Domain of unknown function (DUF4410)